ncbi:MAG: glycosyl transferase family 1, partial [Vicinamibacteria bacterium]
MKISYWSPLSPSGTGVADYSEELLPHRAKEGIEIHLFVSDREPSNPGIREAFPWHWAHDYEEVAAREKFDLD